MKKAAPYEKAAEKAFDLSDKLLESVRLYADALLLHPLSEVGGLLSDQIGFWRLRNRVRCLIKAKTYLESQGISPGKLHPEIFVPLIEASGDAEDDMLSDMFASLFAAHLDESMESGVHPSYCNVLKQLSSNDAVLLTFLIDVQRGQIAKSRSDIFYKPRPIGKHKIASALEKHLGSKGAVILSLENLSRLGIIPNLDIYWPEPSSSDGPGVLPTAYGRSFFAACTHAFKPTIDPPIPFDFYSPAKELNELLTKRYSKQD